MTTFVISGGTDAIIAALATGLRAERIFRLADDQVVDLSDGSQIGINEVIPGGIASWIHVLPDESSVAGAPIGEATASLLAAVELAEKLLLPRQGASFTMIAPVWGVSTPGNETQVEIAAATASALMRSRVEAWSADNRRINMVRYVPPDVIAHSQFRGADVLEARSPMHRLPTTAELTNAIDFLASAAAAYVTGSVLEVDGGWNAYSWFYPARDL